MSMDQADSTEEINSKKQGKCVEREEEDDTENISFMMALLEEPTGRKLVISISIALLFMPMLLLLGQEFLYLMLLALILTSLIAYPVLTMVAGVDLKSYLRVLLYGSPTPLTKKDE